jgi:serine-type D-Ala-D-Ala carboxypeptidase/endopeptidase (penicillin-binding protein 4)
LLRNKKSLMNRRQLLAGLMAGTASIAIGVPALANPPKKSPRPKPRKTTIGQQAPRGAEQILAEAKLSGDIGFIVADAASGKVLESRNAEMAFPPASVTKAITTLYGLDTLGRDYRFSTWLVATGPIENGTIKGDLYLVGGGDPTLDSDGLGELARQLNENGVREISGKAYVHSGALPYQKSIDASQPDYLGYNPSLSGLNLNFNRVFFQWKREANGTSNGYTTTMEARAIKFRPRVAMSSIKVVDRKTPTFEITSTLKTDKWTVAKKALGKKGGRWLPVRRPEFYAAEVFATIARSYGIQLPSFKAARIKPKGTTLASWQSERLDVVLQRMMKHSTNLTAEAVGVTATQARGVKPAKIRGSARVMTEWLKSSYGSTQAKFVDHSGLAEGNRLSASDMHRVLNKQGWDGAMRGLMKDIDLRDDKGKKIKNSPIKVTAKTGTLNFVSCLSGYVETPKKGRLVFAVFSADMKIRAKISKADRERPKGARRWNKHAKKLQQKLIENWVASFDA